MNILELCDFYSNYGSNFIPSLKNLEKALKEKGHQVFFIFSKRNLSQKFYEWEKPFEKEYNTTLMDFSKFSIITNVVNFIKANDIKIVHAHFIASFFLSEIKKRTSNDVKFFEHIHSAPYSGKRTIKSALKGLRNVFLLDHSITKITVSEAIVPITKFVYPFTNVIPCRNSIDFSRLKKKKNNYIGKNKILLFGYNYSVKGVDLAIDAILRINKEMDVSLDIVMGDNLALNKQIITKQYGRIPECVHILEPTNDIVELYNQHQVFLNASRAEGISYAIIEAYYSGLLCVVSDVPATIETNLPNVWYFKSNDADSLYHTMKEALKHINAYENNIEYVENKFSINDWCEKIINIFGI